MNFGDTHLSPSKSDDSGYGSTESFDDNPVIKALVFDMKNDYDERDSMGVNSDKQMFLKSRINRCLCR